jgi:hypothetical protein
MTKTLDGIILRDFLEILLGTASCAGCPEYIAQKVRLLDPEEIFAHVEFPNDENELSKPRIWWAVEWRTSYTKYVRTKELSARERQVYVLSGELRAVIVKKLCAMTGLEEEQAIKVAIPLIKTRNEAICQAMFGMNLADLLKADLELTEYKNKIGAK